MVGWLGEKNYYERLEVPNELETDVMQKAYHKLSRKYHPDKGRTEADFQALGQAHDCLKDPFQRSMYDSWLKGDQKEPFNTNGIPDLSEMWPEGSWWQPMIALKRIGLLIVLFLLFGGLAIATVAQDWWEWFNATLLEIKRYILACLLDGHAWKTGTEEEVVGEVLQSIIFLGVIAWYAGACSFWARSATTTDEALLSDAASTAVAVATGGGVEEAVAGGVLGYFGLDFMHSLTGLLTMNLWLADADAVPGTTSAGAPMPSPMPSLAPIAASV